LIKLEGRIVGAWAEEFRKAWQSLQQSLDSRELLLDLCDVIYIDEGGKQTLRQIYQSTGAVFVTNSPLTKYFAEEAMRDGAVKNEKENADAIPDWK